MRRLSRNQVLILSDSIWYSMACVGPTRLFVGWSDPVIRWSDPVIRSWSDPVIRGYPIRFRYLGKAAHQFNQSVKGLLTTLHSDFSSQSIRPQQNL
jgi:hypothetical protein